MIKHGVRSALVLGSIGRRCSAERDWIAAAEWGWRNLGRNYQLAHFLGWSAVRARAARCPSAVAMTRDNLRAFPRVSVTTIAIYTVPLRTQALV